MRLLAPEDVRACTHNFDNARLLGRGGFGEVYRGDAIAGHDGAVAVKRTTRPEQRDAFMRELRIASSVDHPNVIQVLAACVEDPPCFVMPLMQGSLADWLGLQGGDPQKTQRLPRPTPSTIKAAAIDVFKGVKALHTATPPIVHLDLKPQNLLLDERGAVKVVYVGLARTMEEGGATHLTTLHVGGTMRYWCPVYMRSRRRGPLTDVYSLGAVLLEMLVGDAQVPNPRTPASELPLKYGWQAGDGVTAGWLRLARECMSLVHDGYESDAGRPTVAQALARLEGLTTAGAPAATAAAEIADIRAARENQDVHAILVAMRNWPNHTNVQRVACTALWNLCGANDAENKSRIGEAGGVDQVLSAMRAHETNAGVQEEACSALGNLSYNHAENARRIGEAGGVAVVLSVMRAHETSADVQEEACSALGNLAGNHADNARRIVEAGGLAVVLSAMRAHETSAVVQNNACRVLQSLSLNHAENDSRIGEAGGVDQVLSAMRAHETNAGVQEAACSALGNLSHNHAENARRIVEAGGLALVRAAMHAHETNARVQEYARGALANLPDNLAENAERRRNGRGMQNKRARRS
ncbi:putative leucine-rich repeat receptor-like protein kinase [Pseudoscourfieldia marina]